MRKKTLIRLVIFALLCGSLLFAYSAMKFDRKVKAFNSEIHIGDNLRNVRAKLGAPSRIIIEHKRDNNEEKDKFAEHTRSVLWIYYGSYFLRKDLCLVFDELTGSLVEKKRGFILIE